MKLKDLIGLQFEQGLGELLVLHIIEKKPCLGTLKYEKGRLIVRDQGLLADLTPSQLVPCWDSGIMGMACVSAGHDWESLTFFGLERCKLPMDLSATRHGALVAAANQYGDSLIDFVGSIYRGLQLMLDNHFLPVVLLKCIQARSGEYGLAISDLRAAPMAINTIQAVNEVVRQSVDKRLTLGVEDKELDATDFEQLFGEYLRQT